MTTRTVQLSQSEYTLLTMNPDFMIQANKGTLAISLSLTLPDIDAEYIVLNKFDVITSTIIDGTVWGRIYNGNCETVSITE